MVMRLVRDDEVREDGNEPQGIAATGTSRPRRRSRSVSPAGSGQLKMGTDEQLDTLAAPVEEDGASDRSDATQDAESQEPPDGAVAAATEDDAGK